ncbi:MAG TPA: alpha/beta hydrolase [Acidimicrobiia bacterium]|nr:alpha/beta hydrolase [Acidimicrobiia bacterium]
MAGVAQPRAASVRMAPGRPVELAGRGAPYVRRLAGPPGSRTVVLLHGLSGAADLTWMPSYRDLSRFFSVVALDLRGHGRGIPHIGTSYRLEDCADDVAALVGALGVGPVIAVGYSMGGTVAQLLWQRHPEAVAGLVFCSTAADFRLPPHERLMVMAALTTGAFLRTVPPLFRLGFDTASTLLVGHLDDPTREWARGEFGRCGFNTALAAAMAVSDFSSRSWITAVDVPAAVVLTGQDRVVPPWRQRELAELIPGSAVHEVDAGHGACLNAVERFLPALLAACRGVDRQCSAAGTGVQARRPPVART